MQTAIDMYSNPIILADYSDPDVIRVDDTYYMTASSFSWTPGLPLLESHDMVEWNIVGYAINSIPLPQFDTPRHSKGVWAPAIRFYDGHFVIAVGLPDEGIFVVESQTASIRGKWKEPRCVWEGKGFIDPCPVWCDDGKAYIVHAYAYSRIGIKSRLGIFEVDPDTLMCKSEDEFIFLGDDDYPVIEGPKVYKVGDYYHILSPAGGVKCGYQADLRSKNIKGPFEARVVLSQGESHINGPHQGGLVEDGAGNYHFLHFQDRGIYGRVILLEPASYHDGWFYMGTGAQSFVAPGEPVDSYKMPRTLSTEKLNGINVHTASDNFPEGKIGLQWQWQANQKETFTLPSNANGGLKLAALSCAGSTVWDMPNLLTQKITKERFAAKVTLDASNLKAGARAGLVFIGDQYATIAIEHMESGDWRFIYIESKAVENTSEKLKESRIEIPKEEYILREGFEPSNITLSLSFAPDAADTEMANKGYADKTKPSSGKCTFKAECKGVEFYPTVPPFACKGDHWVGGRFGVFSLSLDKKDKKAAGFVIIKSVEVAGL